jgi:predicted nucleic acid-binding Zn ribbon protein
VDEENVVDIPSGVLCSHKKNEIMSFAGKWIEVEIIILRKNKSRLRRSNITCFLSYAESRLKKKKT